MAARKTKSNKSTKGDPTMNNASVAPVDAPDEQPFESALSEVTDETKATGQDLFDAREALRAAAIEEVVKVPMPTINAAVFRDACCFVGVPDHVQQGLFGHMDRVAEEYNKRMAELLAHLS